MLQKCDFGNILHYPAKNMDIFTIFAAKLRK